MIQVVDKGIPSVIYTNNATYRCKLKGKLEMVGLNPAPISRMDELLDFLFMHEKGIVLVDSNSIRLKTFILKYSKRQIYGNVSFIFMNDNSSVDIECDNVYSFLSSYDRIDATIAMVINKSLYRKKYLDNIPELFIDKQVSKVLSELSFPKTYNGYSYIKDCVHIMLSNYDNNLNLKQIYARVSSKYGKNASAVEKSIRQLLGIVFKNQNSQLLINMGVKKVSNLTFLKYVIERIKNAYGEEVAS